MSPHALIRIVRSFCGKNDRSRGCWSVSHCVLAEGDIEHDHQGLLSDHHTTVVFSHEVFGDPTPCCTRSVRVNSITHGLLLASRLSYVCGARETLYVLWCPDGWPGERENGSLDRASGTARRCASRDIPLANSGNGKRNSFPLDSSWGSPREVLERRT
jgi:hypothetical protein